MRLSLTSFLPLVALAGAACAVEPDTGSNSTPVVYGDDDRQDIYAFADVTWAARTAEVSAVMVSTDAIDASNPDDIRLPSATLQQAFGVCPDERFATQPTAGDCSATLIAPDLVLTAGHCISSGSCGGTSFVFDYWMTDASTLHSITTDDVYHCAQVMARTQSSTVDFAVVRLDRDVVGRTPAAVDVSGAVIANTTPLIVQGYPSGLPLKIDDGGVVRDGRPGTLDYFVANLDTFGGNSGSGVFTENGTLVGILVRGETDYVQSGRCYRVNRCADDGCSGESSTYAFRAIASLCGTAPQPGLCVCGDGTCDAADGETSATCPLDCGASCGDGVCNGTEHPDDCSTDCTADVPDGDACGGAIELTPIGTQVIDDSTDLAVDDLAGSCVGGGSGDRVYTFTLVVPTRVDAGVTGYDTGLYLERTCGDTASEIACNDDVDPGNDTSSALAADLAPGTYALIVDGYGGAVGTYQLTVAFSPSCADADLDGTCDENDGCPDDPDEVEPGACGCGVADGMCNDLGDGGCCSVGGRDPAGGALLLLSLALARRRRVRP